MNEELLKSLSGAIDTAIKELATVDTLSKSDKVDLQDAKLRPETANGTLPGDNRGETALKPEDAHKGEQHMLPGTAVHTSKEAAKDPAAKGENPFADKDGKKEDKEGKGKEKDEDEDDEDMDDEKAEKMKAKMKKWEDEKAAKAAAAHSAPGALMSKSEVETFQEEMTKTLKKAVKKAASERVDEMAKSFDDRFSVLEGMIAKLAGQPIPRQSQSGLAPLVKNAEDAAGATSAAAAQAASGAPMQKSEMLDKLFEMQKSGDSRINSQVIARVDNGDYSVLTEKSITLK